MLYTAYNWQMQVGCGVQVRALRAARGRMQERMLDVGVGGFVLRTRTCITYIHTKCQIQNRTRSRFTCRSHRGNESNGHSAALMLCTCSLS